MSEEEEDKTDWLDTNTEAIGEALAAGVGLFAGMFLGPAGAIGGAFAGPYAVKAVAGFLALVADRLGVEPAELELRAASSDARREMLAEAVQAVLEARDQRVISGFVTAVANGLDGDDARVDEERLVVVALASMDAPHLKLLRFLAINPYGWDGVRDPVSVATIADECPGFTQVTAGAVITTLERHHCVARREVDVNRILSQQRRLTALDGVPRGASSAQPPVPTFQVTDFGLRCLDHVNSQVAELEE